MGRRRDGRRVRARRQFIGLQRRHPKILFPVRRLLRREPEVVPVAWQAHIFGYFAGLVLVSPAAWLAGADRREAGGAT